MITTPQPLRATLIAGLELEPADPVLLQALSERCEADQAWEELHRALGTSLGLIEAGSELEALCRYYLGKASFELGRHQEARPHLERARDLRPDFGYVYQLLGRCCRSLSDDQPALAAFQQVTQLLPAFPWGWLDLGELLLEQNQIEPSVAALQRAQAAAIQAGEGTNPVIQAALERALQTSLEHRRRHLAAQLFPVTSLHSPVQDLQLSLALLQELASTEQS